MDDILAAPAQFQYPSLDTAIPGHFRLIEVAAGTQGISNEAIECTLITSVWTSQDTRYEALSYVWGESTMTGTILLNSIPFQVTENLYIVLQYLRCPDRSRTLWIDAICIDQKNVKERNHQVAVMGQIYRNCSQVVVWLGEADAESHAALDFVTGMIEILKAEDGLTEDLDEMRWHQISPLIAARFCRDSDVSSWEAVLSLLARPWFTRAWVVQEFICAPTVHFMVGNRSVLWQYLDFITTIILTSKIITDLVRGLANKGASQLAHDVFNARFFYYKTEKDLLVASPSNVIVSDMPRESNSKAEDLIYLLKSQRRKECKDPRDKVYSIIGIADTQVSCLLAPDYSRSAQNTYMEVVKAYVKVYRDLNILRLNMYCHTTSLYPSWCPDWERERDRAGLYDQSFKGILGSSGGTYANVEFLKDDTVLWAKGIKVDSIQNSCVQSTSAIFKYNESGSVVECNWNIGSMVAMLLDTVDNISPDDMNAISQTLCRAFMHTLVASYYFENGTFKQLPILLEDEATDEWWP